MFDSRAHAVDALGIGFMKGEVMQRFTLRELADQLRDLADGQVDELGELLSQSAFALDAFASSQQEEEDDRTMMFRVDGDAELLEGVVIEKFESSPVVIDGISLAIDPTELPAFVVDCGDRGSWLVPSTWEVK